MFGLPSEEPRTYWRPEVGLFTVSPSSIGDLTPYQIEQSFRYGQAVLSRH